MIALQVFMVAMTVMQVISAAATMTDLLDWLADVSYTGAFARHVLAAVRLAYQRGLFDGFVAGVLTVLILKKDRS